MFQEHYKNTNYLKENAKNQHSNISALLKKTISKKQLSNKYDAATLAMASHCYLKDIMFEYQNDPESFNMSYQAPLLIDTYFNKLYRHP